MGLFIFASSSAQTDFAHYQVPEHYIQLTQIPKTSVGKFDKKELMRMYAEGSL